MLVLLRHPRECSVVGKSRGCVVARCACGQLLVCHLIGCLTLDREDRASISSFVKWSWLPPSYNDIVKMERNRVGSVLS